MSELVALPAAHARPLADRVIIVTGAHGDLGKAAAVACAQAGATVVLVGRRLPKLNRVYDAIRAVGPEPALYPIDLAGADPSDFEAMADRIETELGRLDGVLHCAADFAGLTPLVNTLPEQFARQMQVNLSARWFLTQACLPLLQRAADAAVVFVLDDPERVGGALWGAYGIAQHANRALMAMLHQESEASSVRVCALQPGPMRTPLRSRAFVDEKALRVPAAAAWASACVHLLSPAGAAQRGRVHAPPPEVESSAP